MPHRLVWKLSNAKLGSARKNRDRRRRSKPRGKGPSVRRLLDPRKKNGEPRPPAKQHDRRPSAKPPSNAKKNDGQKPPKPRSRKSSNAKLHPPQSRHKQRPTPQSIVIPPSRPMIGLRRQASRPWWFRSPSTR